jgi:transcriptional regulator with XRE-family HTH domain
MANEALRRALSDRRMSPNDLAAKVGADPKTVGRWLSDEGRTPHPRLRWAVADALEVDESVIWPQAVRGAVKTGPDREIVAAYTSRAAVPKAVWRSLISESANSIVFAGYTSYFAWLEIPDLVSILASKAEAGCAVRFLLGDPDSEVTRQREEVEAVPLTVRTRIAVTLEELRKLRDLPRVQTRLSDRHISLSVFLFDDQALVCQHLGAGLGHDSPTFHLRRRMADGLFDRFRRHVDALWDAGRPAELPA